MKKIKVGDYVEVNENGKGYHYSGTGSLGKVVFVRKRDITVEFDWLSFAGVVDTPTDFSIFPADLTVIPKVIYDIKLKVKENNHE